VPHSFDDPSYLNAWVPTIFDFVSRARVLPHRGMTVTSWWRSPRANRVAGGARESQHIFALALDLAGTRDQRREIMSAARRVGLVAVDEGSHVHVQAFPAGALGRAGVRFPT